MSSLTEVEISKLRERGFKEHTIREPQHAAHWREVAKQPLAFFYSAKKETFMRELDRRSVPYRRNQNKSELQQLLLDSETDYFNVICHGMLDALFPVHKDATVGQILQHYNRAARKDGRQIQFTSISCEGTPVALSIKISELASVWQSSHTGIERNIITVDAH